jgi:hypothetical protein
MTDDSWTNENDNTETVVVVRGLQSRSSARHVQYVEYQRCTIDHVPAITVLGPMMSSQKR